MIDLRRELGAERRTERSARDEWRALRRFQAIVWLTVAIAAWLVITAADALEPSAPRRLIWTGVFALVAALVTSMLPKRFLLAGDLTLRLVGTWVLYQNVEHNLPPRYWLLCLPMFMLAIVIPALFYRAIPLTIVMSGVVIATAQLVARADAPVGVRMVTWSTFVWIMVLLVMVIQRLATERRRTLDAMTHLAETDVLTGLANRRHFMVAAAEMLAAAHADRRPCTLILMDIDHFKSVNDVYGHDTGDQVLVGVARGLRGVCRTDDVLARLGGEEFAILMLGASVLHAQHAAAELASTLRDVTPIGVTASYGVVEAKLGEVDISELLIRADLAMYQAKRAGRNRCVVET